MFGRAARHPGEALLKTLAFLITLVALAATVPSLGQAYAKPAPVQKGGLAQGEAPGQKQAPVQKQAPAQGQAPASGQPAASGQAAQPMGPPAPPPPAPPPPEQVPVGPVLDQLSASIKQIEASLERNDRTDAELQDLRQQIDPVPAAVSGALDRLTPRLDANAPRPAWPKTG